MTCSRVCCFAQYLSEYKLRELIRHYSEFVTHPVSLREIKTIQVPVEKPESEEKPTSEEGEDDDIEVSDDEDIEEAEPEMEDVTTYEYVQINTDPAVWARDKDSITDEEYQEFWKVVSKDEPGDAEEWIHFNAE